MDCATSGMRDLYPNPGINRGGEYVLMKEQALWKNIEGSQKFLPALPGRHVVQNAGLWIELDNATWKPRRAMQIFLLNDHLLVAARRKKKVNANGVDQRQPPVKLVADRCWPLLEQLRYQVLNTPAHLTP